MTTRSKRGAITAVAALEDPTRRALYDHVCAREEPTSRDEAAQALGLSRSTAAFHLDRLAEAGLLAVEFRRLSGRTGPGAGRPSKLYARAAAEVAVSVPERRYELAGELFARAIEQSASTGESVRVELRRVAAEAGRTAAADADTLEQALEEGGFEPRRDPAGGIVMGNCPFHQLAQRHTELVCQLNYELLRGVAAAVHDGPHTIVSDPGAGRCCVRAIKRTSGDTAAGA